MGIANASVIKGSVDVLDYLVISLSHATQGFGAFTESLSKINLIVSVITVAKRLLEAAANSLGPKLYSIMKQNGEQAKKGFKEGLTGIDQEVSSSVKNAMTSNGYKTWGWGKLGGKNQRDLNAATMATQNLSNDWDTTSKKLNLSEELANAETGQAVGKAFGEEFSKGIEEGTSRLDALKIANNNKYTKASSKYGNATVQLKSLENRKNQAAAQLEEAKKNRQQVDSSAIPGSYNSRWKQAEAASKENSAQEEYDKASAEYDLQAEELKRTIEENKAVMDSCDETSNKIRDLEGAERTLAKSQALKNYATKLQNVSLGITGFTMALGVLSTTAEKFNLDGVSEVLDGISSVASTASTALQGVSMAAQVLQAMGKAGMAEKLLTAGPYVAVFMAIAAAIAIGIEKYQEWKQEQIDTAKEIGETVKSQKELTDSYDELLEKRAQGEDVNDELLSSGKELVDSLEIENGELMLAAENWEGIAEAAKKARQEEAKANYDKVKKGADVARYDLTKARAGSDANEVNNVENTDFLKEKIDEQLKKYKLDDVDVTADGDSVKMSGVEKLSDSQLVDYYSAMQSAMDSYGAVYDNSAAVKSWDNFMDKVQERLEEMGAIVESEQTMYESYYEVDENGNYEFEDQDSYNSWLNGEVDKLRAELDANGITGVSDEDLKAAVLGAIEDAGLNTTDMAWWESFGSLSEEVQDLANSNSAVMDALKSGKVSFDSDSTAAEIKQAIGEYYADVYGSMGSDTAKAANTYLEALGSGEEITDAIKSELLSSLENLGLKDAWENGDYENKSYKDQSEFLMKAVEMSAEVQESYYDDVLEQLTSIDNEVASSDKDSGSDLSSESQDTVKKRQNYIQSQIKTISEKAGELTSAQTTLGTQKTRLETDKANEKDLKTKGISDIVSGSAATIASTLLIPFTGGWSTLGILGGFTQAMKGVTEVKDSSDNVDSAQAGVNEAQADVTEKQQELTNQILELSQNTSDATGKILLANTQIKNFNEEVVAQGQDAVNRLANGNISLSQDSGNYISSSVDLTKFWEEYENLDNYEEKLEKLKEKQAELKEKQTELNEGTESYTTLIEGFSAAINDIEATQFEKLAAQTEASAKKLELANTNLKTFKKIYDEIDQDDFTIDMENFGSLLEYDPELLGTLDFTIVDGKVKLDESAVKSMKADLEKQVKENAIDYLEDVNEEFKLGIDIDIDADSSLNDIAKKFKEVQKATIELENALDGTKGSYSDLSAEQKEAFDSIISASIKAYNQEITNAQNTMQCNADMADSSYDAMVAICAYNYQIAKSYSQIGQAAANAKMGKAWSGAQYGKNVEKTDVKTETTNRVISDENAKKYKTMAQDGYQMVGEADNDGWQTWVSKQQYKDTDNWEEGKVGGKWKGTNKKGMNDGIIVMHEDYGGKEYQWVIDNAGIQIDDTQKEIADKFSGLLGNFANSGSGSGSDDDEDDESKRTLKSEQDLVNLERQLNNLTKERQELEEGGIWTAAARIKKLNQEIKLLEKEKKIQEQILEDKKESVADILSKNADKLNTDYFSIHEDERGYTVFEWTDAGQKAVDEGLIDDDTLEIYVNLQDAVNEVADQQDVVDDNAYQLDERTDEKFNIYSEWIDQGVEWTNSAIDSMGQLAQSAISMLQNVAQAALDGFNSYLGWLTIKIDDDHDIGELDESLSNIVDRLDWEYEKLLKKQIAYNGTDALNEKEVFENSNQSAKNVIARMQNQRRLYENSFRQLEDLGLNISSELTEAFESLYDRLYGADGPFTRLNKSINNFKGKLEDVLPNVTSIFGEVKGVVGNLFSKGQEKIGEMMDKLFPNSIIDDIVDSIKIDNYSLGDFGKSNMQKLIELFTELTPSFNADYQIANKAELVDALSQKMETIITNDTITSQFVKGYLDYLTEVESQMESEVSNIRSSEKEILDLYDTLTEILERGKDEYSELAQDLYDAITDEKNSLLEELQALNDNITDADSEMIEILQANLDLIRQQRDNNDKEKDLQAKEARLAYLRQDTSGANLQEILKLQDELEDEQQDYTDELIDQKISELETQNDQAADQRQVQIDLLQAEVDNTEGIWETVEELLAGISKFDKYLTGEIDRDGYKAVIEQLKKGQSYLDSSSVDKEETEKDWNSKIRAASLYRQVKDNLSEEYEYLKLAAATMDRETQLPKDYAPNEGWHNYVAFSSLEQSIDRSNDILKQAVTAINNLVEKITISYDDEQSLHMKTTYYGGVIQAVSGTEYAATKAVEDLASNAPGILTQLTTGIGNIAKGVLKSMGSGMDSSVALFEDGIGLYPDVFGNGVDGGGAVTKLGDLGEAIGYFVEGMSNFAAAATDAASMGMDMIGDMAPGFADIGVAIATSLKETFFNDYERVNNELEDNIDVIIDMMGNTLGTSGYLKEIRDGIQLAKNTRMGQPDDETYPIYDVLQSSYRELMDDYKNLLARDSERTDVEGFNILYNRTLKLKEILGGFATYSEQPDYQEKLEIDPSRALEAIQKWRGEIGTLFTKIDKKVKDEIISLVNGILSTEGKTLGDKGVSRWIDIYDGIVMLDTSSTTIERVAAAMEEYEPELANKLYKLFDRQYAAENTPQESFTSFWSHKLTGIWGDVSDFFDGFWDKLKSFFSNAVENITGKSDSAISQAFDKFSTYLTEGTIGSESKSTQTWLNRIFSSITGGISSIIEKIKNLFGDNNFLGNLWDKFKDSLNHLPTISGNTGILEKIRQRLESLFNYASGGTIRSNQRALVGEAGAELIQHARGGATYATGPSLVDLEKGDVVYNAAQTRKILSEGNLNFSRFAEGTATSMMARTAFGYSMPTVSLNLPDFDQSNKESTVNLNLNLEDLTVDTPDRVDEVAERVMDKISNTINGAMWPYNRLN